VLDGGGCSSCGGCSGLEGIPGLGIPCSSMPSLFIELSPVMSPAGFFSRPSNLSSHPIGGLLAVCTAEYPKWPPKTPDPDDLSALRI
jgi:hypothetical protein